MPPSLGKQFALWSTQACQASQPSALPCLQVDLLYLHNPAEMQLAAIGTDAFMQRLKAAFSWAEKVRKQGLIRAYGLATWSCFRSAPGSADYLSLHSVVQLAKQVGGNNHGFRSDV